MEADPRADAVGNNLCDHGCVVRTMNAGKMPATCNTVVLRLHLRLGSFSVGEMCRVAAFDGTVAANGLVSERTVLVVPKLQPLRWAAGAVLTTMCVVSNAVRIADIVNNIPVVGLAF